MTLRPLPLLPLAFLAACQARPAASTLSAESELRDLIRKAHYTEARALAARHLADARAQTPTDPADLIGWLDALAAIETRLAEYRPAGEHFAEALQRVSAKGTDPLLAATVYADAGTFEWSQANWDRGLELAKKALAIRQKKLSGDDPDLADALDTLGFMLADHPDGDDAQAAVGQRYLLRAWAIRVKKFGPASVEAADSWSNIGLFFLSHDPDDVARLPRDLDPDDLAEKCLKKALAIRLQADGRDHPETAESMVNLAYFHLAQEDLDTADRLLADALPILEKALGPAHPDVAYTLDLIARVRLAQERPADAIVVLERALAIYEMRFHPRHYFVGTVLEDLVEAYTDAGQKAKAASAQARLDKIRGRDL